MTKPKIGNPKVKKFPQRHKESIFRRRYDWLYPIESMEFIEFRDWLVLALLFANFFTASIAVIFFGDVLHSFVHSLCNASDLICANIERYRSLEWQGDLALRSYLASIVVFIPMSFAVTAAMIVKYRTTVMAKSNWKKVEFRSLVWLMINLLFMAFIFSLIYLLPPRDTRQGMFNFPLHTVFNSIWSGFLPFIWFSLITFFWKLAKQMRSNDGQ